MLLKIIIAFILYVLAVYGILNFWIAIKGGPRKDGDINDDEQQSLGAW